VLTLFPPGSYGGVVSTVLAILAIAVLLVLVVISATLSSRTRASEKQEEDARMQIGKEQHESSLRRRADVRAAPAEPSATIASGTDGVVEAERPD
jgi:hypothetical protein